MTRIEVWSILDISILFTFVLENMKKRTETKLKIATIGFLTLSMAMMLFPRQKATTIHEIQFVRNNQQLTNSNTHGAAGQWDYLFEDEETVIQKDTQTSVGTGGQTG